MTQPPLTRETIAALSGRSLDAAYHATFIGPVTVDKHGLHWSDSVGLLGRDPVPQHTHDDYRGLAAMVESARVAGWQVVSMSYYRSTNDWHVRMDDAKYRAVTASGSTLPTAFARALLLATLPENAR